MVSSRALPSLERKPGGPDNWVERAGGLPDYIERVAKQLHYTKGKTISHAIAAAVNTIKRWAKGGTVTKYGTVKRITPATQALAIKALAEWEAKKKAGKINLSDDVWEMIEVMEYIDLTDGTYDEIIDLAETCAKCSKPATKKVIWADGRAYQPSCDEHVKAVQNSLTAKNGKMTELAGVQDLSDADISDTDTMVAFMIDPSVASGIAVEGGVPADDMHVTVLFYGETDDAQYEELKAAVEEYATGYSGPALKGTIGGLGTFPASDPEKGRPWWVPVDVPGINTVHEQLLSATEGASTDHGYSPHMTLSYVKEGDAAPEPVDQTEVEFSSLWVVRGNTQRDEYRLGGGTGADQPDRAILSENDVDLSRDAVNIQQLAERANRVEDPVKRAAARRAVLDLASTIPPRNAKGRVSDGRKSFKGQGKWKHGFVPVSGAAKEAKAKGSPIAMKRMRRLFGKDKVKDAARKSGRENTRAATGRVGNRSAVGRTNPDKVRVNERGTKTGSESANDVAFLRNTKVDKGNRPNKDRSTEQLEASKDSRVPTRARQNWAEIPEALKTERNGKRYVLAEFGGRSYLTEWVGGVREVTQTSASKRKVMSSLTSADAAKMSPAALRDLVNNPRNSESARAAARKALTKKAKEAK